MSTPPVLLADLKGHLNITDSADDAVLTAKLQAASDLVEEYLGATYADLTAEYISLPAPILEAVKQITAHLYGNREPSEPPSGALDLLIPYRAWAF